MAVQVQGRTVAAGVQKAVLWALVNRSDSDGSSHPSQKLLAEEACFSRASINAAVAALASQGFLEVLEDDARRSRTYVLDLSHTEASPSAASTPRPVAPVDQAVSDGDRSLSPSAVGGVAHGGTIEEPPKEPPTGTTHEPLAPAPPSRSSDPVFEALFEVQTGEPWEGQPVGDIFRGRLNRARAEARAMGWTTREHVLDAARLWPLVMPPGSKLTALGLVSNGPALNAAKVAQQAEVDRLGGNLADRARTSSFDRDLGRRMDARERGLPA